MLNIFQGVFQCEFNVVYLERCGVARDENIAEKLKTSPVPAPATVLKEYSVHSSVYLFSCAGHFTQ